MAAGDRGFRTRDDASSIALLRSIRSGVADFTFVHHADVCAAAPEDLVANLEPAPGTDLDQGGYNAVWYFYCPKRFKNANGDRSGHRQRSIAGGDTCWHSESSPKPVKDLNGATVCNLSYGRKEGSSKSFNRMGWCMLEYDDKHDGGDNHVLCKIYRSSSSLARAKSLPTNRRLSGCKRKVTSDHAESLPTKMNHAHTSSSVDLDFLNHEVMPWLTDDKMAMIKSLFSDEEPLLPVEEQQFQRYAQSLLPAEEQQFQHNAQSLLPAEEQQFHQHNIRSLSPAEEQQFQHYAQSLSPAEEQQFQHNVQSLLPAEEQQFHQHNIRSLSPAEEQQLQHTVQSLLPAEEQQLQFEDNTLFTIGELLGLQENENVDEFMISRCCRTPTAVVADTSFFEGLAF